MTRQSDCEEIIEHDKKMTFYMEEKKTQTNFFYIPVSIVFSRWKNSHANNFISTRYLVIVLRHSEFLVLVLLNQLQ